MGRFIVLSVYRRGKNLARKILRGNTQMHKKRKGEKIMNAKKLLALLLALTMVLSMAACGGAPAETTGAPETTAPATNPPESTEVPALTYIPAPYTVDAEIAGPKEYLEPKFYANGEGEPTIGVTYVGVIVEDGKYFKDSDNDKELDIFEDWRLDDETRAKDLVSKLPVSLKLSIQQVQMTLTPAGSYDEIVDANGKVDLSKLMTISEKVIGVANDDPTRANNTTAEIISFGSRQGVLRTITDAASGALYNNATNMVAEYAAVAKGEPNVPFVIIANPQAIMGEPATMGVAAAVMGDVAAGGDYSVIQRYADLDRQIWYAKGIDRMYGQQIDLITDPRWTRNTTTFTEDPTVLSNIAVELLKGYQGGTEGVQLGGIPMIMKHFPGDSAAYNGLESHSVGGQYRVYQTEGSLERYFLPAFQAAVDAKVAGIMPCYSRPLNALNANQTYRGVEINPESTPSAYNATILQTLLRDTMGFEGFVNTDSGIMTMAAWGVEDMEMVDRIAAVVNAGSDVVGDYWGVPIDYALSQQAYDEGKITDEALDRATLANVKVMFATGEYENPYRDPAESKAAVEGIADKTAAMGYELSSKSLVLLKNHNNTLPLKETGKKVFVASFTKVGADDAKKASWEDTFTKAGYTVVATPEEAEILLLDVAPNLNENSNGYNTLEIGEDVEVIEIDTATGKKTGDTIEFTTLADADKIKEYADIVHNNGGIVLGSLAVSAPWILTNLEPYCDALIVNFASTSSMAAEGMAMGNPVAPTDMQMDLFTGKLNPTGKLPITMVSCSEVIDVVPTVIDGVEYDICVSPNDVPGYDKDQYITADVLAKSPSGSYAYKDADGNIYKAWFGLSY